MWQRFFSQILQNAFDAAQRADPKLSLRGFARRLDVSPSVLSELLRDQRKISAERALEIARMAEIEAPVLEQLEKVIHLKPEVSSRQLLTEEAIDLVMNPHYYRLLSALEVLPIPTSLEQVAHFLDLEPSILGGVVEKLKDHGILTVVGSQIYWGGRHVTTTEDIPSTRIQEFHRESLRQADRDLALPVEEREYTSVIFAGCREKMPHAKSHVRQFRDTLSDSMRDSKPDSVYQLTIQLRPVSRVFPEKDK